MAIITNTIGSDGGDTYATIQLWDDDGTATTEIETNGNIWEGNMRNEAHTISTRQTLDGHTTTASAFKRLTCLGGTGFESFIDQFSVETGLAFNANGGARLEASAAMDGIITVKDQFTVIERLMIKATGNYTETFRFDSGSENSVIRKCILEVVQNKYALSNTASKAINCFLVSRKSGDTSGIAGKGSYGSKYVNCTIVVPSDIGTGALGLDLSGGSNTTIHCAIFRFATAAFDTGWSGDWNASDDTTGPGANSVDSLTYADQFTSTTADWTLKSGNSLAAAGEDTDGDVPSEDILENSRPAGGSGAPVAIGCIEPFVGATGGPHNPLGQPLSGALGGPIG